MKLSWWFSSKEAACNAEEAGLIPGLGRSLGEGNGNPLQYSSREIPWTEEPGELQFTGLQKSWMHAHAHTHTHPELQFTGLQQSWMHARVRARAHTHTHTHTHTMRTRQRTETFQMNCSFPPACKKAAVATSQIHKKRFKTKCHVGTLHTLKQTHIPHNSTHPGSSG